MDFKGERMEKKHKIKNVIVICIIFIFCIIIDVFGYKCYADYGDFESYDSGSSDGWSSYDSDSSSSDDWSSYDSGSRSRSNYGSSYSDKDSYGHEGFIEGVIVFVVCIAVAIGLAKKYTKGDNKNSNFDIPYNNDNVNESDIIEDIKKHDPNFSAEDFKSWVSDLFIKMQYGWSNRNIENLRAYESPELYEQTLQQINQYISGGRINVIERAVVLQSKLIGHNLTENEEHVIIQITSRMNDYIIDEKTRNIIKGNPNEEHYNRYNLMFKRAKNSITNIDSENKHTSTMNCPNCGAPTEVTSSGKCQYCGSIIVTISSEWTLTSIRKITNF